MFDRDCSKTMFLVLGLLLSLYAAAEEHNTPLAKSKTAAAKQADVVAVVDPAPATRLKASATAKQPEAEAIVEKAPPMPPVVINAPEPVARNKPHKTVVPRRVALASPSARAETPPPATENVAPAAPPHSLHWSYEGPTGPQAWARMSPEFARCGSGERQSPIDIREGMKVDLEPIIFEYRPSPFKVIDNGHTIQANVGGWNSMRVMGRRFRLVQFHFHRPSEEAIDGRQFEMVVHLVHKDSEGRLGVVAVLVDGGVRQPAIQAVLNNLPLEKGEEVAAATNLDLAQILPESKKYFTYMGSLTTPPCSEDVLWVVMKQPVQASVDQLDLFSRMYPMNARPIQSAAGRMIKESN